jgi:putative endonuclease
MKHWVYIILSNSLNKYYKGYSLNVMNRVDQHNNNESRYTANKGPWELVFAQSFETKTEALKREKVLKKYSKAQIIELCKSKLNQINELG